jgi:hypothetical protein
VPFYLFLSLSANDNVLPSQGASLVLSMPAYGLTRSQPMARRHRKSRRPAATSSPYRQRRAPRSSRPSSTPSSTSSPPAPEAIAALAHNEMALSPRPSDPHLPRQISSARPDPHKAGPASPLRRRPSRPLPSVAPSLVINTPPGRPPSLPRPASAPSATPPMPRATPAAPRPRPRRT